MPSNDVQQIGSEIGQLEADITELKGSLSGWDNDSASQFGAKKYNGIAKRIVLQAEKLAELIKEKAF
jgi:hypothetical protein